MAQYFCLPSRRGNRRIAGYLTIATTQKASKKTSQNAQIIQFPFLRSEDLEQVKLLEQIARQKNNSYYYNFLGYMFNPISNEMIQHEEKKRRNIQLKEAVEVPSEILDNLLKIKDFVSSKYYFSLAFNGIYKLAKNGDSDAMPLLSYMFFILCTVNGSHCPKKWKNKNISNQTNLNYRPLDN